MKITALETFRPAFKPNLCLVRLHTDDGLTGLGESYLHAGAAEAYLHDFAAPMLFGAADATPERVAALLTPYVGFQGGGVETRANGAVDLALWDLLGKRSNLPVVDLLGGAVREAVRIYNTCAGPGYISDTSEQRSGNWGLSGADAYEDLEAFLRRPGKLARELRDEGIGAMKIWPFDLAAEQSGGTEVLTSGLDAGIRIVEDIRNEVGMDVDLMIELHGLWQRGPAVQICRALEPFRPYWVEDPIRSDAVDALADLAGSVATPIALGETSVGRRAFLPLLQRGAISAATVDVQWTGGLTEARKVASLADTFGVPVAPHDCTGPVTLSACCHLVASQPNGLIQETSRAFLRTWYPQIVTGLPEFVGGRFSLAARPGLGVELTEDFVATSNVARRLSQAG